MIRGNRESGKESEKAGRINSDGDIFDDFGLVSTQPHWHEYTVDSLITHNFGGYQIHISH